MFEQRDDSVGREDIFPSRLALATVKNRIENSKRGYALLNKQLQGLKAKQSQVAKRIVKMKAKIADLQNNANMALARAKFLFPHYGTFAHQIIGGVGCEQAKYSVEITNENIAGLQLPSFNVQKADGKKNKAECLNPGIADVKKLFGQLIEKQCELAGLQAQFMTMEGAVRLSARRVFAMEHVFIPRLQNTARYIKTELDEKEREDFFRLKKVIAVKKQLEELEAEEKRRQSEKGRETALEFMREEEERAARQMALLTMNWSDADEGKENAEVPK